MSFKIEHFSIYGNHITLRSDGSIELYNQVGMSLDEMSKAEPIIIEYRQAYILKAMIIAEHELMCLETIK